MGLFWIMHTRIFLLGWRRIPRIFYIILPEVVGFTLTLGFASCVPDRTDKTERADPPTGEG